MSRPESHIVYEFGDFRLDVSRRLLLAKGVSEPRAITPKAFETILCFVEHPGELLDKDRLMAELWPGLVVEENSLTQVISMLRRILGEARGENRYIATVPGRGYRFVAHVTRLPDAPDTQPTGVPRASVVDASSGRLHRSKLVVPVALAASALGIALFAYAWHVGWWQAKENTVPARSESPTVVTQLPPRSIAVLPFQNLSTASGSELFAAGLADTILHQLASLSEITVIAGTSSFLFKDRNLDTRDIGRKLNARYLLEGSVQSDKDRLRVTAQLIDATTASHVWSLQFDREPDDVFAVQDEIAVAVARALGVSLDPTAAALAMQGTTKLDAYLAFIHGRSLIASRKIADGQRAIERFSAAITLDPKFAAAYAALAAAHMQASFLRHDSDDGARAEADRAAAPLIEKALALDPHVAQAYVVRADLKMAANDAQGAEADFRQAIALNPNDATTFEKYADFLGDDPERYEQALALARQAARIDPLTPRNHHLTAVILLDRGSLEEAEVLLLRALELAPDFYPSIARLGTLRHWTNQLAEAVKFGEQAIAIEPHALWVRMSLINAYLDMEDADAARQVLEEVDERRPEFWLPIHLYERKLELAAEIAFRNTTHPEGSWAYRDLLAYAARDYGLASGQLDKATEYLELLLKKPDADGNPVGNVWIQNQILVLAQLRLAAGDRDRANTLATASLKLSEREAVHYRKHQLEDLRAVALALLQRNEEAMEALEKFSSAYCWRWWYLLQSDPSFAQLRSDPRFQILLTRARAHAAEERKLLEAMRRAGRVPDRSRS
jgi:TolB-like protein/DNA-binding winged helix-turn-helix (wHTH) protein/Tfp pilus assembly protein PilF